MLDPRLMARSYSAVVRKNFCQIVNPLGEIARSLLRIDGGMFIQFEDGYTISVRKGTGWVQLNGRFIPDHLFIYEETFRIYYVLKSNHIDEDKKCFKPFNLDLLEVNDKNLPLIMEDIRSFQLLN